MKIAILILTLLVVFLFECSGQAGIYYNDPFTSVTFKEDCSYKLILKGKVNQYQVRNEYSIYEKRILACNPDSVKTNSWDVSAEFSFSPENASLSLITTTAEEVPKRYHSCGIYAAWEPWRESDAQLIASSSQITTKQALYLGERLIYSPISWPKHEAIIPGVSYNLSVAVHKLNLSVVESCPPTFDWREISNGNGSPPPDGCSNTSCNEGSEGCYSCEYKQCDGLSACNISISQNGGNGGGDDDDDCNVSPTIGINND